MRRIIGSILALSLVFAPTLALAQNNSNLSASDKILVDRVDANGVGTRGAIGVFNVFNGLGIGYGTGGGGVVTQATSRTTGVTLNTLSGQITMFTAAGSATPASFTVTDSAVKATDTVEVVPAAGTNLYEVFVTSVAAGSFQVTFFTTGGTASDTPVLNFATIHAATS